MLVEDEGRLREDEPWGMPASLDTRWEKGSARGTVSQSKVEKR